MLSSECDDDGGGVGQSDLLCDGRPATERGALQVKEEKEAAKEAFDATALAQFLACLQVGGKQERFF